ncbi:tRNA uridine-5-carboxymethylaminomethyl(34) synthesis GTPase MnmE [Aliiroseovarius subalbicans]|uniref:tRNA uridine-5-carboxymethylaminomethyl(34) synthesis GTPase MnmE n=1 Tax=Aliiroseovarius subalbicans TaxID=2925840 RepID=UPI001F5AD22E|nr:tRNA uridine-5-carboxymethylaminomethyl(34) synthesis GTPase MnmE [Aliiroseovarius subalbicans]MCI2400066.1 tRNA uridine-5-carboxymethylaminomethyl(34) synthesis GTPase MnmE [Aliiroseovarius subalbicans]
MDTIYALATAHGKAGVAVIRISGPAGFLAASDLTRLPNPRVAGLRRLVAADGTLLDEALVLCFQAGASFTGEDVVEFQLHGSTAVVNAVLRELGAKKDLRLAEPGEFTRRALENGCLDLAQVEGLADLIDAETEAQRRQAQRVLSGALGDKAEAWRTDLIRAAALLEATIDFADEDVPVDVSPEVLALIDQVASSLEQEAAGAHIAERVREGFEIAIVGPPNIGKSTLLNALAGRDAAITSEHAGTTRDVIEVRMDLDGLPVTVLDTAGLRDTTDEVEGIGIARARDRASQADLRVFLLDESGNVQGVEPRDGDVIAQGKADLRGAEGFSLSGKTGQGVDELIARASETLRGRVANAGSATRERHRLAIVAAGDALGMARIEVLNGPDRAELASEELRTAIRALDSLVGRVDVEHILDEIFASFCLGK